MKRKSSAYWKKRTDEIMAYVDRTDIDFFDELQSIYTEGRQNVQKEIYAFYAQYAKDNQITMQEAQKQLRREDLSDYRANAEKYFKQAEKDPELLKRLNEQYRAGKVTRLEALELNLEWQLGKMNQTLQKSFNSYLKETAQYVYKKISGGNSSSTLNKPALEQLVKTPFNGKNYSSSLWGNTDTLADDLKQTLKNGFIRGQGPADMARELRKKYNVARSRSEAIIRTDGTNIINNAAAKRYMEFGLTKYKILVHLDERTTDICKKIKADDETFLFEEYQPGKTAPPFHVNCRSGIVPDDSELGYEDEDEEGQEQDEFQEVDEETEKNLQTQSDEWLEQLEPNEFRAMDNFTDEWFDDMNGLLMNPNYDSSDNDYVYFNIQNLDKAINKFSLEDDIITYRGISAEEYQSILGGNHFKEFKSTSADYETAKRFSENNDQFVAKFKVAKGSNAAYVGLNSASASEKELVINRGATYSVKETSTGLEVTINGNRKEELPAFEYDDDY